MRKRHLTISALALILMAACTDATGVEGTGVEPDALAGTWTATSLVFTQTAAPNQIVEEVSLGATMTLMLAADGSYTFAGTFPNEPAENETGTYIVSGSTMTITPADVTKAPETMGISRNGNTLTLTMTDTYDFTLGVEEPATLVAILTR